MYKVVLYSDDRDNDGIPVHFFNPVTSAKNLDTLMRRVSKVVKERLPEYRFMVTSPTGFKMWYL